MDLKAQEKWNRVYADSAVASNSVTKVLREHEYLLPEKGTALDLACGLGSDAVFLAQHKLQVLAWDISDSIVDKLNQFSQNNELPLVAEVRDVSVNPPRKNTFDVIVVAHYLERKIIPDLIAALRPRGLIFYQTFLKEVTQDYSGPLNPDFRLGQNELLHLFSDLNILFYQEDGLQGNLKNGFRNEAMLIAQKSGN